MTELESFWRTRTDQQLADAIAHVEDYTTDGQLVIRAEQTRRGMPLSSLPQERDEEAGEQVHGTVCCSDSDDDQVISAILNVTEGGQKWHHLLLALAGTAATLIMWYLHLTHAAWFANAFPHGFELELPATILLVPPFVTVLGWGNVAFSNSASQSQLRGPMSGYLYLQQSGRKWKIMVCAIIAAILNCGLMRFTAGGS